jgi:hypothetical protein
VVVIRAALRPSLPIFASSISAAIRGNPQHSHYAVADGWLQSENRAAVNDTWILDICTVPGRNRAMARNARLVRYNHTGAARPVPAEPLR